MIRIQISGGLGDVFALTPVLKALKLQDPARQIEVFFVSEDNMWLMQHNPHIDLARCIQTKHAQIRRDFVSQMKALIQNKIRQLRFPGVYNLSIGTLGSYASYRMNMAQILAQPFELKLSDTRPEIYLSDAENSFGMTIASAYRNPVIINPVIRSRKHHTWPLIRWQQLIKAHPENDFLQLGLSDEPLIKGAKDFRSGTKQSLEQGLIMKKLGEHSLEKYGLREMVAIIKHSQAYAGMDTFWQHAAAAVNTPGVVLFGDGHPAVFGHDLHINLYKNLRCAPCSPNGLLNGNANCPYGAECIMTISVEEVSKSLLSQLI